MTSGCPEQGGLTRTRRAATCVRTRWGVSDPLRSGSGTASGGWQRGSLTPHITVRLIRAASQAAKIAAFIVGTDASNGLFFNDLHGRLSVELFVAC